MSDLLNQLKRHEGSKRDASGAHIPYEDTVGKLTIGYGRNLSDCGLSDDEAELLLANDIARVKRELDEALPWWRHLDWVRKMVLINMGFNLGVLTPPGKAKLLTFSQTLDYIKNGQYAEAAEQMLKTKWAQQVGGRAVELAGMMRTGLGGEEV